MKQFKVEILICIFFVWIYLCSAKDSIRVGIFFTETDKDTEINWDIINNNLEQENAIDLPTPEITIVPNNDIFESKNILCNFIESLNQTRLIALFGPEEQLLSDALESVSSHLNVPYFLTSWKANNNVHFENVFNMYPDSHLLAEGLAKIVNSFVWDEWGILYEDNDGLFRLQEVLKLQKYKTGAHKNLIYLQQLNDVDNRSILKKLRHNSISKIILDCHVNRIMDILNQAQEVGLLSDFSTSFFLTSLDAHTLDYSGLKTLSNITTVRLFDPTQVKFREIVEEYFPNVPPNQIKVKTALIHDAQLLISQTINSVLNKKTDLIPNSLHCTSLEKHLDELNISTTMQTLELNEGTLTGSISLLNGQRTTFNLDVIEIDKPENPIAKWNSDMPDKIYLTRNATEREYELLKRMQNYNFIITSRIGPPYLYERTDSEVSGNRKYYGYSMDLISEIAKIMNITFEFKITAANSYKNLVNDLIDRRADMGICDFTITPQRREVIDFSMPFMNLGIGILHKNLDSEEVNNMYAFMRPISWTVWFYITTLNFSISMTMVVVARLATKEWENPKPWDSESKELENIWTLNNFFWLTMGSITTQGCDILPKSSPTRIITGFWWIFSLIITSSYTANLAAFLTMGKKDVTVDNVEELAAQSKIKYGLLAQGSTEAFFSNSNNTLYQKMWNTMKNEKPTVFESDNAKGVERVLSTKNALYAFFMESTGIEFIMERNCDLRKIGNLLDSKSYGIGMPMNADYRHSVNKAILRLQESGHLLRLKEKWWKPLEGEASCKWEPEDKSDSLALSNVGGIFVVLAVGIALAFAIGILQFLWNVRTLSVEEHLTYFETLKFEVKFAFNIFAKKKRAKPLPSNSSSSSSGSSSNSKDRHKLNITKNLFDRSVSLLTFNNENKDTNLRNRSPATTRTVASGSKNNVRIADSNLM